LRRERSLPEINCPPVRQLAVDLAINPNTVLRAYRELELGGTLELTGDRDIHRPQKTVRNSAERSGNWRSWLMNSQLAPGRQDSL